MYATYERGRFENPTIEDIRNVMSEAYQNGKESTVTGKPATYIPELAKADGSAFGLCMLNASGDEISFGDVSMRFSMQSVSKVVNLAAALKFHGFRGVFSHVLMEPTGDDFSSIIKLDTRSDLPFNPMINAGAIQIVSLLVAAGCSFEDIMEYARMLTMDTDITLNQAVYESERETGDRNRSIAYLLKSKGVLQADPMETVDLYFKLCSLNVTAKSLAGLGLIISENGRDPYTGAQLIEPGYVRTIKSLMFTCGMYDFSGEWGVRVGIPSKSGVSGGVACAAKKHMGFGCYGPAVDAQGNSVAAIAAMVHISHMLSLHVFDY